MDGLLQKWRLYDNIVKSFKNDFHFGSFEKSENFKKFIQFNNSEQSSGLLNWFERKVRNCEDLIKRKWTNEVKDKIPQNIVFSYLKSANVHWTLTIESRVKSDKNIDQKKIVNKGIDLVKHLRIIRRKSEGKCERCKDHLIDDKQKTHKVPQKLKSRVRVE